MINVTKAFRSPREQFDKYVDGIWQRVHLTNHGSLVFELEEKLKHFLGVNHFYFLNNRAIAIQLAIKALYLKGDIITIPFSYVASTSSIVQENVNSFTVSGVGAIRGSDYPWGIVHEYIEPSSIWSYRTL